MFSIRPNTLDIAEILWAKIAGFILGQDVGEANDRIKRRTQFMRHAREKFTLRTIGELCGFECGAELRRAYCHLMLHFIPHLQYAAALFLARMGATLEYLDTLPLAYVAVHGDTYHCTNRE